MADKKWSLEEFNERNLGQKYNLTKDEAHLLLTQHEVSDAKRTQVLNRWLNDGIIDAVLVGKGRVEDRGWRISEESLKDFIEYKKLTFGEFLALKKQIKKAAEPIKAGE
jgi:hypothetical protein